MSAIEKSPVIIWHILIDLFFLLVAFYSAWENLRNKRISKFGFNAVFLTIGKVFDKNQVKKYTMIPD
jgi:hypothetical protein